MKWLFYVIISIPHNPVHTEGHSSPGKYFSHLTVACFQCLEHSSVQWLCQPLGENVCPKHTWCEHIRKMITERWYTAGGCNPCVPEADPETLSDCTCQRWPWESAAAPGTGLLTGLLSLKLSASERTSFSLIIFSEHALLFNRWWSIIKEYIHYWCLSKKFLLTSASFPPYNASFRVICITLGKSYSCIICNMNHLFYSKQR